MNSYSAQLLVVVVIIILNVEVWMRRKCNDNNLCKPNKCIILYVEVKLNDCAQWCIYRGLCVDIRPLDKIEKPFGLSPLGSYVGNVGEKTHIRYRHARSEWTENLKTRIVCVFFLKSRIGLIVKNASVHSAIGIKWLKRTTHTHTRSCLMAFYM